MTKMVEYIEPVGDGSDYVVIEITDADAIEQMKAAAKQKGFTYLRDEDAFNDFIAIHWAKVVPDVSL